jgi:broad specificity phosphatase PhoE
MLDLWLIRHGETDWNAQGRILSATDVPLNPTGRAQAARLRQRLARSGTRFDAVYTSDTARAWETAVIAWPEARAAPDARLRELAYGVFEGRTWEGLDGELARLARHWREDPYARRAPDGESYDDVIARFEAFRADLPSAGRVAACSHGGTIRCVLYGLMGRPVRGVWHVEIANTGVTRLRFEARQVTLVTLNDHAHLVDL